jgi:hypothetical protein
METMTNKSDTKDTPYDFGDDAEAMLPGDPAFDAWITRVAPTLNAPNATPRLEMWQAIQSKRRASGDAGGGTASPGVTPLRRRPWGLMSAIAAALLLGVAIDRFALRRTDRVAEPVIAGPSSVADSADPARLYRMAAAQTLTQAEALLTAYRASGAPDRSPLDAAQLGKWGREVLSSTRLLIDSPAGDDPQLRALLADLELVLVQVIQLSGAPLDPADRELIDRALADRDLLPRIRTAVPAGITGSASAD